ncbi:P-loop containing nucleoside triphosphate hydrolase protein [Ochromonadaceae sp. CCMP2298]|nr:P-loop containing nucleoside triphosphate hydrolase protein [Ochromonadaceae sp. CCMP2298]
MTKSLRQVEGNKASEKALAVDNDTVRLRPNNPRDSDKLYTFDRVFSEDASQAEVGGAVQEQLLGVLIGFNTTLICCGASKSGKSYTMTGSREQRGVLPQVVQELFSRISALQEGGGHFYTEMCYVELHNNVFHDLLLSEGEDNEASDTDSISMLDSKNLGVFLSGSPTLHRPVSSALDVFKLYSRGQRVRSSRVTDTGHVSSRSHTVLVLHVESREAERVGVRVSKLTFVEMAGAERLEHSGVGFKQVESRHINLSLNAFGNVLRVLSENAGAKGAPQLVPYNESKLTHLLKESLGGNSRTVLITTVHATADYSKVRPPCTLP